MRTVVVYPGRFQPMLSHHAEVYRALLNKYASNDVYVATTDKVEPPKSPFNFLEKQSLITLHGVKPSHVLRVRNPYNWQDYTEFFSEDSTVMIFVLGPKDAERLRGTKTDPDTGLALKKDGSPAHIQDIQFLKDDPQPMSRRVYVELAPRISDDQGQDLSASQFREKIKSAASERAAKKIFTQEFGGYDESAFHLVYRKIKGTQAMNEHLNQLRKLAGLSEAGPIHFGGSEADPTRAKFTKKPESGSEPDAYSISKRFPPGADVTDPAQRKEQFLKELSTSPNALLGEINGRLDPKDDNSLAVGERLSNVMAQLDDNHTRITSLNSDDRDFVIKLVARAIKELELGEAPTSAEAEPEEPDQEADQEADQTAPAPAPARESRDFMRHLLAIMEQMGEKWVIHKGKHEPGEKSSLAGQTLYGVTVKDVYTDRKEAQEHADKINAGRGYKPEDAQNPLYGGVLYIVSPAKSMVDELTEGPDGTFDPGLAEILKQRGYTGPVAIKELSPDWQDSLGRLLDDDDLIMVQGDDPEYDGWVAFMGGSKYAYGAEMGYHKGNAKQVERHTRNQQGMTEGAEDQKLGTLAREIEMQVAAHFPDSEGLDAIMSKARKIYGFDRSYPEHMLMDLIDAAAKKHLGSDDFYSYVEDFHAQHASDNPENMYEQGMAEGATTFGTEKFSEIMNALETFDDSANLITPHHKAAYADLTRPDVISAIKQSQDVGDIIDVVIDEYHDYAGDSSYDSSNEFRSLLADLEHELESIRGQSMSESDHDPDSVGYDDEDENDVNAGIDWDEEEQVDEETEMEEAFSIKEGFEDAKAFAEERAIRAKNLKPYVGQTIVVWQEGHLNPPYETELRIDSVTNTSVVINGEKMPINGLNDFVNYNAADDYMWKNKADADHYASIVDEEEEDGSDVNHANNDNLANNLYGDDDDYGDYDDYGSGPRTEEAEAFANAKAILAKNLKPYVGQKIFAYSVVNGEPYQHEVDVDSVDSKRVGINGQWVTIDGMESIVTYIYDEPMWKNKRDAQEYIRLNNLAESRRLDLSSVFEASGDIDHGTDHADDDHDNLVAEFDRGYALYNKSAEPKRHVLKRNGKIVDGYYGDTKSVMGHMRWLGMREQGKKAQPSPEEMPMPESRIDLTQVLEDYGVAEAKKPKKSDGNLANNYPPYDKVTKGDVIAGRLGKDQKGGKGDQVSETSDEELDARARKNDQLYGEMQRIAQCIGDREREAAEKRRKIFHPEQEEQHNDGDKEEPMKKALRDREHQVAEQASHTANRAVSQALAELRKLAGLS